MLGAQIRWAGCKGLVPIQEVEGLLVVGKTPGPGLDLKWKDGSSNVHAVCLCHQWCWTAGVGVSSVCWGHGKCQQPDTLGQGGGASKWAREGTWEMGRPGTFSIPDSGISLPLLGAEAGGPRGTNWALQEQEVANSPRDSW